MKKFETPYYLIDESILINNLKKVEYLQQFSGAKVLLSSKCLATCSVFPQLKKYVSGTSGSSLYEVRLGNWKIGKETHAYCAGYKPEEMRAINKLSDKIIFNSVSQLQMLCHKIPISKIGLRINPMVDSILPNLSNSRLGEPSRKNIRQALPYISGVTFHFNHMNTSLDTLIEDLRHIEYEFKDVFKAVKWVNFGGGISFTSDKYPIEELSLKLKEISHRNNLQVYLEPGEAVVSGATQLVTSIVDIVRNGYETLIVDASAVSHMPNLTASAAIPDTNKPGYNFPYRVSGRSCLSDDNFGVYNFKNPLLVGELLCIQDSTGYAVSQKNWGSGLQMPQVIVRRISGNEEIVKRYHINDFLRSITY